MTIANVPVIDRIVRSRRRTVSLQVTADAQLIVRAPKWVSYTAIQDFVNDKQRWIRKRQRIAHEIRQRHRPHSFVDGESFLYLGERWPFSLRPDSKQPLEFDFGGFSLGDARYADARACFQDWYRRQAESVIPAKVRAFAARFGLRYRSVRISAAVSRWGSCSSKGTLNFSWRLMMAPMQALDYVVAHELAHLVEHNHSKRFWAQVSQMFPAYRDARRWLRENQQLLEI